MNAYEKSATSTENAKIYSFEIQFLKFSIYPSHSNVINDGFIILNRSVLFPLNGALMFFSQISHTHISGIEQNNDIYQESRCHASIL